MPSHEAHMKVVILWAEEVRIAARALHAMRNVPKDAPDEEHEAATVAAFRACDVAIYNPMLLEAGAAVVVSEFPIYRDKEAPRG